MLTPMLVKFNWGGVILSVIAFLGYMLIKYSYLWQGMKWLSFPLCVEYLPFYTLGILAGNSTERMKLKGSKISMFGIPLFAGVSFVEAAIWNNQGKQAMAMSQGKVASYCFAMSVVLFFLVRATNINGQKSGRQYPCAVGRPAESHQTDQRQNYRPGPYENRGAEESCEVWL